MHRSKNSEKGVGGGIGIAVLNVLDPSWVIERNYQAEALTVENWIESFPVRLVCGLVP